jgi:hypothetical protein
MKHFKFTLLIICVFTLFFSCNKKGKELDVASNLKVFDVALFRQRIVTQLNGSIGYTVLINKDGKLVDTFSFGISRVNATGGGVTPISIYHDINIASVTKPFTAIAAIKLMEQKGILMNFPIGAWLPNSWQKSTAISQITFQELLTHNSGIRMSSFLWDSLQALVSNPQLGTKTFSYSNANFALFRALLPKLNDASAFNIKENNLSAQLFREWMSQEYISIMNDLVFNPAQVYNASCNTDPNKTTIQAFSESNIQVLNTADFGDWTERSGGGGFYLSPFEMAQVMAYLAHTNSVLNSAQKKMMDDNLLGWDPNDSYVTNYGTVYGKDGFLYQDFDSNRQVSAGDPGLQTWVGKFPNKVELVIIVNSIGSSTRDLSEISQSAYLNAWVSP